MSSKSSNLLLDIMGGRHERTTRMELEFSVDGFIFTYVQKYISSPLTEGDRPHGPPMDPPLSESECCMLSNKIFPRPEQCYFSYGINFSYSFS